MDKLRKVNYSRPGVESYEAYFHGFFHWLDGDEAGPIALIKSLDGKFHGVDPDYLTFPEPPEEAGG